MTLGSLILFAAVYFAAVATPGPGLAALVARVIAYGLVGVAPFIAGYVVGDIIWLVVAGTSLAALAKSFAGAFTAIKYAGAAYLLYLAWRTATAPRDPGRSPAARVARASRLLGLAVADARQPEGDGVLSVDHAARGRREEPDADAARRADGDLHSRDRLDSVGLRARRQPGAGAVPFGQGDAHRPSRRRRGDGGRRGRGGDEVSMSDLLAIGEPLVELNQAADGGPFLQGFGGDTSNAMIAAARVGADASYFTAIGADRFGQALTELWMKEGVDASRVVINGGAHTGLYFVTHGADGRQFSYMRAGSAASRIAESDLPVDRIKATQILHVSGISQAISSSAADAVFAAIDVARDAKRLVSYDPNLRLKLWPLRRARAVIHEAMRPRTSPCRGSTTRKSLPA